MITTTTDLVETTLEETQETQEETTEESQEKQETQTLLYNDEVEQTNTTTTEVKED